MAQTSPIVVILPRFADCLRDMIRRRILSVLCETTRLLDVVVGTGQGAGGRGEAPPESLKSALSCAHLIIVTNHSLS